MTKAEKDGETPAPGVASGSSMKMEAEAEAAFDDAFGVKEGAEMGLEDWNMGEDICGSGAVDEPDAEAEDGMWPNSEPSSSNNMCCFCGQYPKNKIKLSAPWVAKPMSEQRPGTPKPKARKS